jgi:Flp pilus assembly pilin Flp
MTMLNLLNKLRQDENGVILSAELVIIGSLLVVGMITGLTCLQQSVNGELRDVAGAIGSLDQSYAFSAHRKPGTNGQCCAWTAGSSFTNCERKQEECVNDVVGCQDILIDNRTDCCQGGTAGCTGCGQCGGGSSEGGVSGCGGCGGCNSCRSPYGPRCIDTGVPNMKATEWRLPQHAPVVSDESVIIESGEVIHSDETVIFDGDPQFHEMAMPCPLPDCRLPEPCNNSDLNIPDHVW